MYTHVQAVLLDEKKNAVMVRKFDLFVRKKRWRLVKGTRAPGEKPEKTLKREVAEETGLRKLSGIKRVFSYSYSDPFRGNVRVLCLRAFFKGKPRVTREAAEEGIDAVRIVPAKKAIEMLFWKKEKQALAKATR